MKTLRKIKFLLMFVNLKLKIILKKKHDRVFLMDVPEYGNLGDQAIAIAEEKFIKENYTSNNIIIIKSYFIDHENSYRYLKKIIKFNDIICLTGGGSMDENGYIVVERFAKVVRDFCNNKIIIFPQTITFSNSLLGKKLLNETQSSFNYHKNLHLFVRDEKSLDYVKGNYTINVTLVPDIALYLCGKDNNYIRKNNAIILFRDDKEKNTDKNLIKKVYNKISERKIKCISSDTFIKSKIFKNRGKYFIFPKLNLNIFLNKCRKSKLIVTDRLHGMIFGAISGTYTIAFNNSNGKVKGVYKWLKNSNYIFFVENYEEFSAVIDKLDFTNYKISTLNFRNSYNSIMEGLHGE